MILFTMNRIKMTIWDNFKGILNDRGLKNKLGPQDVTSNTIFYDMVKKKKIYSY